MGAGIAGLAAARALEIRGFHPEIVEQKSVSPTAGQSLFLLGNAMRALGNLGLQEEIAPVSYPIRTQAIMSSRGSLLNKTSTQLVWGNCGPCVSVLRQTLADVLQSSLRRTAITHGTTVVNSISRIGRREVHFSNGRVSDYDLVIGADGIRSSIRASTFAETSPRSIGLAAWRLMVENRHQIDSWTAMLGMKRTLLTIPLRSSKLYLYADCPANEFGDGSIRSLKRLFADFAHPLGSVVSELDDSTSAHRAYLEEVPLGCYVADRLVLIGDAAHASSPNMAQGAAMALEDAVVLADCITGKQALDCSLSEFHERRKHRVEWVRKQCHARDKLRGAPDPVRNLVLLSLGTRLYHRSYNPLVEPT
ncbi:FAD-dependent monooxygenase [Phyllobacterium sp. SB3]|uniref:FAD-dependent monooxygenase n=1 Tax=Phyllobacterium sp. SB3 TaxID=3156073 RepID=UPI0032AFFB96